MSPFVIFIAVTVEENSFEEIKLFKLIKNGKTEKHAENLHQRKNFTLNNLNCTIQTLIYCIF